MLEAPCPSVGQLAAFVSQQITQERRHGVESHLGRCAECRAVIGAIHHDTDLPSGPLEPTLLAELLGRSPLLAPGTRIGRYVVNRTVGAGGMGRVYAAYDPTLDRQVALKLLHPGTARANLEARLLREAKTMARLAHHPEIVPVYDAGRHGAQLFIAMEFVEGGTLRAWLAAQPRSWEEIVALLRHAGRGLAHAHEAGLVHRDFKPDNVLVGEDGRVRVSDFGLARVLREEAGASPSGTGVRGAGGAVDARLTRTGTLVGTPAYMAPEQLRDGEADTRSDIFSFCVTLYEALYGERPFKGNSVEELLAATSAGRLSPPRTPRSLPRALDRVLHVGLRPNPEDRYRSMNELLEALDRGTSKRSRSQAPVVVSVFAAASVATGIAFGASGRRTEAPPSAPAAMVEESRVEATASAPSAPPAPSTAFRVVSAAARSPARARPLHPRPGLSAPVKVAADPDVSIVEGRNGAPIMR